MKSDLLYYAKETYYTMQKRTLFQKGTETYYTVFHFLKSRIFWPLTLIHPTPSSTPRSRNLWNSWDPEIPEIQKFLKFLKSWNFWPLTQTHPTPSSTLKSRNFWKSWDPKIPEILKFLTFDTSPPHPFLYPLLSHTDWTAPTGAIPAGPWGSWGGDIYLYMQHTYMYSYVHNAFII